MDDLKPTERTAGTARTEGTASVEGDRQLSLWSPEAGEETPSPGLSLSETKDPPWSLTDLGIFVLFAAFTFLVANLTAIGIFLALRRQFAWEASLEQAFGQTPFVVLLQTGWEMLWLLFIYFLITVKYRRPFWEAIRWKSVRHSAGTYLLAGVGVAASAQMLFYLFPSEKELPIEKLFSSRGSAYLLAVFGICVAPFVEEVVFRGFFYPVFEQLWGFAAAVVLTAGLFASLHIPQLRGGWAEITAIFLVGVVFSYCRGKTGSLAPPYWMHLAYNACLFVSLYFSTDQFRTLQGQ